MKEITYVSHLRQPAANNAYIAAQMKIDECIKALQAARNEMPNCAGWAHAEGTCHDVNELVDATNRVIFGITH